MNFIIFLLSNFCHFISIFFFKNFKIFFFIIYLLFSLFHLESYASPFLGKMPMTTFSLLTKIA